MQNQSKIDETNNEIDDKTIRIDANIYEKSMQKASEIYTKIKRNSILKCSNIDANSQAKSMQTSSLIDAITQQKHCNYQATSTQKSSQRDATYLWFSNLYSRK